jgi:hypothetical protein
VSSRNVLVAALALGLAAAPAAAQTREVQNEVNAKLATERARLAEEQVRADRDQATRERYEEIEIMARLLDRGLGKLAGVGFHGGTRIGEFAFSPDGKLLVSEVDGTVRLSDATAGSQVREYRDFTGNVRLWDAVTGKQLGPHAAVQFPNMQGVYLKGQGIVFTATVPLHFQKPVAGADKPAPKPLTEWERVRKELRGEKVEPDKARDHDDTSLADAVLKVLAENGKNLTRLPDGENVTVALTLLPAQTCASCHGGKSGGGPALMRGLMGAGSMGGPPGAGNMQVGGPGVASGGASSGGTLIGSGAGVDVASNLAEFRKYALMGDLALKQNDFKQAAEAYGKAISVEDLAGDSAQLESIEVATKLARALLAQGKTAEAERAFDLVAQRTERLKGGKRADKPAEKKPDVALPAKLIITVPKKLLDPKTSLDEFRKGVSVEHLNFDKPATKKDDTDKH